VEDDPTEEFREDSNSNTIGLDDQFPMDINSDHRSGEENQQTVKENNSDTFLISNFVNPIAPALEMETVLSMSEEDEQLNMKRTGHIEKRKRAMIESDEESNSHHRFDVDLPSQQSADGLSQFFCPSGAPSNIKSFEAMQGTPEFVLPMDTQELFENTRDLSPSQTQTFKKRIITRGEIEHIDTMTRNMLETEAIESEDEFAGLGGASDDDEGDGADLVDLINTEEVDEQGNSVRALAAQIRQADELAATKQIEQELLVGGMVMGRKARLAMLGKGYGIEEEDEFVPAKPISHRTKVAAAALAESWADSDVPPSFSKACAAHLLDEEEPTIELFVEEEPTLVPPETPQKVQDILSSSPLRMPSSPMMALSPPRLRELRDLRSRPSFLGNRFVPTSIPSSQGPTATTSTSKLNQKLRPTPPVSKPSKSKPLPVSRLSVILGKP
jgi:hypothetical protein